MRLGEEIRYRRFCEVGIFYITSIPLQTLFTLQDGNVLVSGKSLPLKHQINVTEVRLCCAASGWVLVSFRS